MTSDRSETIVRFIPWGLEKAELHSIVVQLAFHPWAGDTIVSTCTTRLSMNNNLNDQYPKLLDFVNVEFRSNDSKLKIVKLQHRR